MLLKSEEFTRVAVATAMRLEKPAVAQDRLNAYLGDHPNDVSIRRLARELGLRVNR